MQKLEIVRRNDDLLQNCSQLYEIKTLNLNILKRFYQNELSQITKEFKDFKYQQNLRLKL